MTDPRTDHQEEPERSLFQRPSRRNFLKVAGGIVKASTLTATAGCDLIFDDMESVLAIAGPFVTEMPAGVPERGSGRALPAPSF